MRKVATAVMLGLAGVCLGSAARADDSLIQPSMLNSNTATMSATSAMSATSRLNAVSDVSSVAAAPRQAMSASMPAGIVTPSESRRLGSLADKSGVTSDLPAGSNSYGAQTAATIGSLGNINPVDTIGASDTPSAWQLSVTPNAARASLVGLPPSDRALTK